MTEKKEETKIVPLLPVELNKVAGKRVVLAGLKEKKAKLMEKFQEDNKPLFEEIAKTQEALEEVEMKVKELALAEYKETGEKKLHGGIGIRIMQKLDYEEEKAFEWAKAHKICLKLDAKTFEKLAKVEDIDFVKKFEVPSATIPTKLGDD
ncbi:MAG: hypothetical protein GY861_17215 [bacterium]|nr:hypothetical protein [bacterium]